jgi:hypothetical protein
MVISIKLDLVTKSVVEAEQILQQMQFFFKDEYGWADRTGVYLSITNRSTGDIMMVSCVGSVDSERAIRYLVYSQEKAFRLADNPLHFSSWMSRKPKENEYGGAVAANSLIFSVCGLTEEGDEALALMLIKRLLLETPEYCDRVAAYSNNETYHRLDEFLRK